MFQYIREIEVCSSMVGPLRCIGCDWRKIISKGRNIHIFFSAYNSIGVMVIYTQDTNHSTGGMVINTQGTNYSIREMVINTQDINYSTKGMIINTQDTNYSIGGK